MLNRLLEFPQASGPSVDEKTGSEQEFIWNFRFYFKQVLQISDWSFLMCSDLFPFKCVRSHIFEEW